jgi:hypothetical protein
VVTVGVVLWSCACPADATGLSAFAAAVLLLDGEKEIVMDELAMLCSRRSETLQLPPESDSESEAEAPLVDAAEESDAAPSVQAAVVPAAPSSPAAAAPTSPVSKDVEPDAVALQSPVAELPVLADVLLGAGAASTPVSAADTPIIADADAPAVAPADVQPPSAEELQQRRRYAGCVSSMDTRRLIVTVCRRRCCRALVAELGELKASVAEKEKKLEDAVASDDFEAADVLSSELEALQVFRAGLLATSSTRRLSCVNVLSCAGKGSRARVSIDCSSCAGGRRRRVVVCVRVL